ncbi:lipase family protein [Dietzia sp. SYD-A1]|uniref:lipase family protein n=1 Tax=Dietzia sp. SYD-A1 TaxID=2780141 RepID=UPI00281517C2|nr:lipase family protein [Dietzia sp. SYD-A1]
MSPRRTALRAAALATAFLVAVGTLAAPATSAQGSSDIGSSGIGSSGTGSSNDPAAAFYEPPAVLPPNNGDLIRSEYFRLAVSLPSVRGIIGAGDTRDWPADGYRIMYRSVGSKGQPIAVTGTYLKPAARWNGGGSRPLAVLAPGTMGQGDTCAPSKSFQTLATVKDNPPSAGIGYEYIQAYALVARGYAVVVPDYEGLGTPGIHSYVHRESSGRAVLDAARAAATIPAADTGPNPRTVFTGYSQGGAAVAAAAEMHPQYAPEVNLLGTAAGSPPADLVATLDQIDGTAIAGAIGYALNSLADAYPEVQQRLDVHLNTAGQQMLRTVADQCLVDTVLQYGLRNTSEFTKTGRPAIEIVREDPIALHYTELQRIGLVRPTTPVRVLAVTNDDVVPGPQSLQLGRDWCERGATVQMDVDETPPLLPGMILNHVGPMITQVNSTVQYLADRIAGQPAPSNCGTY